MEAKVKKMNWFEHRDTIKAFVRKNIIPMYNSEWAESWEMYRGHPDIIKEFPIN